MLVLALELELELVLVLALALELVLELELGWWGHNDVVAVGKSNDCLIGGRGQVK